MVYIRLVCHRWTEQFQKSGLHCSLASGSRMASPGGALQMRSEAGYFLSLARNSRVGGSACKLQKNHKGREPWRI